MQSFGLLGLLVLIAIAGWWLYTAGPMAPSEENDGTTTYGETLDAAQEAADLLSN